MSSGEVLVHDLPTTTTLRKHVAPTPFYAPCWRELHRPIETRHRHPVENLYEGLSDAVASPWRLPQIVVERFFQCRPPGNALMARRREANEGGCELLKNGFDVAIVEVCRLLAFEAKNLTFRSGHIPSLCSEHRSHPVFRRERRVRTGHLTISTLHRILALFRGMQPRGQDSRPDLGPVQLAAQACPGRYNRVSGRLRRLYSLSRTAGKSNWRT